MRLMIVILEILLAADLVVGAPPQAPAPPQFPPARAVIPRVVTGCDLAGVVGGPADMVRVTSVGVLGRVVIEAFPVASTTATYDGKAGLIGDAPAWVKAHPDCRFTSGTGRVDFVSGAMAKSPATAKYAATPAESAVRVAPAINPAADPPGASGVVVASDGTTSYVATAAHAVIRGMPLGVWHKGTYHAAKVFSTNPTSDVAILEVAVALPAANVYDGVARPGPVSMWGVGGEGRTPKEKIGNVTGVQAWRGGPGDPVNGHPMLATTIRSEPGDSGAGVFNKAGHLVGINSGGGGSNAFASPSADVLALTGRPGGAAADPKARGCQCGEGCLCQPGAECGCLTAGAHSATRGTPAPPAGTPAPRPTSSAAPAPQQALTYTLAPGTGLGGSTNPFAAGGCSGGGCSGGQCGAPQQFAPARGFRR